MVDGGSKVGLALVIKVASMALSAGLEDGFHVGLWRPEEGDLVGTPAAFCNVRCSLGLDDGFQVGLCRPLEGDLVGEPAKLRCSTGLEVGGVHRGERPS